MAESDLNADVEEIKSESSSTQPEEENAKDSLGSTDSVKSTLDAQLHERIKQLSEKNDRNKEIAGKKKELNSELLEKLERSLVSSNLTKDLIIKQQEIHAELIDKADDLMDETNILVGIEPKTKSEEEATPLEDETKFEESKTDDLSSDDETEIKTPSEVAQTKPDEKTSGISEILQVKKAEETPSSQPSKNKPAKIALNILFYIIAIFMVLSVLISAIEHTSGDDLTEIMGFSTLRVTSNETSPDMRLNEWALIRRLDADELEINQLALYSDEERQSFGLRYIDQIETNAQGERVFTLRGNSVADELITSDHILGEVVLTNYPLGRLIAFFEVSLTLKILTAAALLIVLHTIKQVLIEGISKKKA